MAFRISLAAAAALLIVSGAALAEHAPGMADLMAPGGEFPGTPNYGPQAAKAAKGSATASKQCFADFDANGDGALEMNELDPNSMLAHRFAARDTNHDGKLTRDEYAFIC